MELSNLKKLRKIIPGTIFVFFSIPAYQYFANEILTLDESAKFALKGYGTVLAFIIGTLFSTLKIREKRNKSTHQEIVSNLKHKLIEYGLTKIPSQKELEKVMASNQLMHIFYSFIDNDESLKEKSKLVRDNGLTWSSTADAAILGCFFSWAYLFLIMFVGPEPILAISGIMIGLIGLISGAVLHPMSVKEHIKLGNQQVEFIATNHKSKLQEKVNGLFT
ncbi:hypothetical protein [Stutzerimonas stutzeri]|uniref:Uncharacterized protein n=1 Tax=Stutzerimonas stutzeri TaxID=316 RepID=A0A172WRX5_STUST|nr:hypothetical protein [Stutzerimonas stutzeri]ANF26261.1 hypothetical protein PS273GM_14420 [Stutzerimonas stutzeri]HAB64357.1 hypothetical protein [Pseudomonas sp.]